MQHRVFSSSVSGGDLFPWHLFHVEVAADVQGQGQAHASRVHLELLGGAEITKTL